MTAPTRDPRVDLAPVAPAALPVSTAPVGPATTRMLRRTYRAFALVAAVGAAIAMLGDGPLDRFGAGLAVPGGGFFAAGAIAPGLITIGLLAPAFLVWWATGASIAVPAVWLAAAVVASNRTAGTVTAGSFAACVVGGAAVLVGLALARRIAWLRARARGRAIAGELEALRSVDHHPADPSETFDAGRVEAFDARITFPGDGAADAAGRATESSPEDLAAQRYALDLVLQPLDRWDGYSVIDQFREAAVRYQLNMVGYALATAQHTRTPAFSGYLAEGQRMAIEKMLEPKAWRYWRWENLVGNLAWDPDPCARDNVMLSGYWGVQIGLYATLNDDDRYSRPAALTFRSGDEAHAWDFPRLAAQMRSNIAGSAYGLFPCEPHWIYPYCSTFALNTAVLEERLHGPATDAGDHDTLARFRSKFEREFVRPDGRLVTVRNRLGFSLPGSVVGGDAVVAYWLNATMPDVAQRIWWLTRRRIPADGVLPKPGLVDRVDAGNYRIGAGGMSRAAVALAARELGDEEVASATEAWLREHAPPETSGGAWRHGDLSVYGNLVALHARFTRTGAMREMITGAGEGHHGPRLAAAPYPEVLVARAVTDGRDLRLVLRPGTPEGGRCRLRLDRLVPGRGYRVTGATTDAIVAAGDGTATISVDLAGRLEVEVSPADALRGRERRETELLAG